MSKNLTSREAIASKNLFSKTDTGLTRPNGKHFEKEVFELGGLGWFK